jgi:nicotinate-nucleotide pyrophosphorylase (carboxylating)
LNIKDFIKQALEEDVKGGDHSTLSCIPNNAMGKAQLKVKENGVIAGLDVAKAIFEYLNPKSNIKFHLNDGDQIKYGDIAFELETDVHSILKGERLALNIMQRMSGIATLTNQYVEKIKNYNCTVLDTRKTTPLFRYFEKAAVKIGGGNNHRFGLYDMIMLKDNHIDYAGSISNAVNQAKTYIQNHNLNIGIEVETRNIEEVKEVLNIGGVQRIMFDNFQPEQMSEAVTLVANQFETEASGGITLDNIELYAATGVQYISVGALTHHYVSLDLSLKAMK